MDFAQENRALNAKNTFLDSRHFASLLRVYRRRPLRVHHDVQQKKHTRAATARVKFACYVKMATKL